MATGGYSKAKEQNSETKIPEKKKVGGEMLLLRGCFQNKKMRELSAGLRREAELRRRVASN